MYYTNLLEGEGEALGLEPPRERGIPASSSRAQRNARRCSAAACRPPPPSPPPSSPRRRRPRPAFLGNSPRRGGALRDRAEAEQRPDNPTPAPRRLQATLLLLPHARSPLAVPAGRAGSFDSPEAETLSHSPLCVMCQYVCVLLLLFFWRLGSGWGGFIVRWGSLKLASWRLRFSLFFVFPLCPGSAPAGSPTARARESAANSGSPRVRVRIQPADARGRSATRPPRDRDRADRCSRGTGDEH